LNYGVHSPNYLEGEGERRYTEGGTRAVLPDAEVKNPEFSEIFFLKSRKIFEGQF
jgi:hypothetical protein